MTETGSQGWFRRLTATPARRSTLVALCLLPNVAIQILNLADVFDGAPTWVVVVVVTVQLALLVLAIAVLLQNVREPRSRSDR